MLNHKGTKTLETSRLILRRARIEDAEPMFRNWANDPEVTKYLTWPPHENINVTEKLLANWVESYRKDDYYQWMIVLKDLGEPIGSIMASTVGRAESAHIGYCIGKNGGIEGSCLKHYKWSWTFCLRKLDITGLSLCMTLIIPIQAMS